MIKVTAKVDETGTSVRMEELSGKLDAILDETAAIVASVVGNILANGTPQGVRPKEFEAFIMQQINKRITCTTIRRRSTDNRHRRY